jgi:hypothetical protein
LSLMLPPILLYTEYAFYLITTYGNFRRS